MQYVVGVYDKSYYRTITFDRWSMWPMVGKYFPMLNPTHFSLYIGFSQKKLYSIRTKHILMPNNTWKITFQSLYLIFVLYINTKVHKNILFIYIPGEHNSFNSNVALYRYIRARIQIFFYLFTGWILT
jgi:hypothetical protein